MARPRIFISSTFYDLKQTRDDLASFLTGMGYEPVRNEEGNIPYGNQEELEKYCYREIQSVDILVSIIGGRYGSSSSHSPWSISNEELRIAITEKKQVYIFIQSSVASEYETYLLNKNNEIRYKHVDDIRIYKFIEEIKGLTSNNNIKEFSSFSDIQQYLKEQFAGLFQSFLVQQSRIADIDLASKLQSTANTLEKLVDYLKETNKGNTEAVSGLLKSMHPLVHRLTKLLNIKFSFWIEDIEQLKEFLKAQDWLFTDNQDNSSTEDFFSWMKYQTGGRTMLLVSQKIFTESGSL